MTHDTLIRLSVGTPAPIFQTQDVFDNPIDLATYAGRTVLLSFFRNGACAICNLQVHKLIQHYPAYHAKGLEILTVFEVNQESIQQYVGKQDAPFPIIADPTAHLYDLYMVETSQEKIEATMANPDAKVFIQEAAEKGFPLTPEENTNFYRMPADFLIGPDGTLQRVFYSDILGTHLPFAEIEQVLSA